jgi:hypothetical protein
MWSDLATLAVMTLCTVAHCQQFALKDGETIVFYGDSIDEALPCLSISTTP